MIILTLMTLLILKHFIIDNEVIGTLLPKYIGPTDFLHNDFIVKVTS